MFDKADRRGVTVMKGAKGTAAAVYKLRMRNRRKAAIKRLMAAAGSLCLVVFMAFSLNSFRSKAESDIAEDAVGYKYYTCVEIQKDDTLWDLASEYMDGHYDSKADYIAEVLEINSLEDPDDIISGQSIILPYYSEEYK